MITKVLINFGTNRYSDASLAIKANLIVERLTNNPYFPDSEAYITAISEANAAYKQALSQQASMGKEGTLIKRNCRTVLESAMRQGAAYVQLTSGGEDTKIITSGYDVRRKPSPIGPLAKPVLQIRPGVNSGTLDLTCTPLTGARSYEFRYALMPISDDSPWNVVSSTKASLHLTGLSSGKEYAFNAAGVGSSNERVWSKMVMSFVM